MSRTHGQLALLAIGLIVWGYGQRIEDERLTLVGVGFFAAAFLVRFFKKREKEEPPE